MTLRHATLRQFQVFEAVARHLSFSRAAAELHLTQPGVSMQVRELEANAGLALFDRLGRRLGLTPAGRELLLRARDVLQAIEVAEDALDAQRGLRSGRVHLGVTSTAKYFAPILIARFRAIHPPIEFDLTVSNRESIVDQFEANIFDVAIMGRPPNAVATRADVFSPHPFVILAWPRHPLVKQRRIPVARIAEETFLVREHGSGTRAAMEQFFGERGIAVRVGMEMPSNETLKQAVAAGMGVSFLSRHTVSLDVASRCLAVLDVEGLPVVRQWYVVHLAAKRLSPAAEAFRAFVIENGRKVLRTLERN